MPLWVSIYFVAYFGFALLVVLDDIKEQKHLWFLAAEIASDAALLLAALSYWGSSIRALPHLVLFYLYLFGLSVFLLQAVLELQRLSPDPELSLRGNVFISISGTALALAVTSPLFYRGFMSAVVGSHGA